MTPYDRMQKLSEEGTPFWLSWVTTVVHPLPHSLDVLDFGPSWLLVENIHQTGSKHFWLNMTGPVVPSSVSDGVTP